MKKFLSFVLMAMFVFSLVCPMGTFTYAAETQVSLEDTPIDVVYCYADLWDHTLRRGELDNSIIKDYDNKELRYSLRSVLKNIPWVRKIFIIMPNDKVRFLKDPEEIGDRIVYVKNEDLLGFDTNSPHVKQFTMWKLKEKFGCSNHIIYMDDDCFIGKPLKKSDFFYVDNNKVVPYVFGNPKTATTNLRKVAPYLDEHKKMFSWSLKDCERRQREIKDIERGGHPEANNGGAYQNLSTYIFLMKDVFKKDQIELPGRAGMFHCAYPVKLDELKELYDYVDKSKYAKPSLYEKRRSTLALMVSPTYAYYTLTKYSRKVKFPQINHISLNKCLEADFDVELFVINEEARNYLTYADSDYRNARNTMKRLFPEPTHYEIPNLKLDIFDFDEGVPGKTNQKMSPSNKTSTARYKSKFYLKRK